MRSATSAPETSVCTEGEPLRPQPGEIELKSIVVADPLATRVEQIRDHVKSLGISLFCGSVPYDEKRTVYWDEEQGGDWKMFLECAKAAGAKIVYLHWETFEESELDEALATELANGESAHVEGESLRAQIEQFRDKAGLTASIHLAFVSDGISHIFYEAAEWFTRFAELTEDDSEDEDRVAGREAKADPALIDKWARTLASHPKYSSCKSGDEREFLLEQLAGEAFSSLPLWPTLRRAETVYVMEIKEQEEERLGTQARELRNQGLNMNAIAKRLRISRDKVSGLLAEESKAKQT